MAFHFHHWSLLSCLPTFSTSVTSVKWRLTGSGTNFLFSYFFTPLLHSVCFLVLDKIKLCFLPFSILQIFKDVVERIPLALSRLDFFSKSPGRLWRRQQGLIWGLSPSRGGGRGDYGLTRLFVKDAQIGCATNNSMHWPILVSQLGLVGGCKARQGRLGTTIVQ